MNRDDIIKLAREVGLESIIDICDDGSRIVGVPDFDKLERFANLVAAAEREACARVAEAGTGKPIQFKTLEILRQERDRIATAIRERGLAQLNAAAEANGEEL